MNTLELDENLIFRMADRDEAAFREIYEKTSSAVYGFALSIMGNKPDAEDVMHDAYINIYKSSVSYVSQGRPLAWIFTIVRNLCYNKLRSENRYVQPDQDDNSSIGDNLSDTSENTEEKVLEKTVLKKAITVLESEERQIAVMHAVTGMKHREIAQMLEMPLNTVISKYNRALKKLRKELEREGYTQ